MEAVMQKPIAADADQPARLPNPFIDFAVLCLEMQLKAWQTYQVEGTHFVAKRMHADLEQLRKLGHCCEAQSAAACQFTWLREIQTDYAEEWGRLAATSFTLGFSDLMRLGSLFGRRLAKKVPEAESGPTFRPQAVPPPPRSLRPVA
jgi:hypothetical protein